MSDHKKNRCTCLKCFKQFRSKDKNKTVCPDCAKKDEKAKTIPIRKTPLS